jgi:hypothetical protein
LYFSLAEPLDRVNRLETKSERWAYYDRRVKEFEVSERLEEAKKRLAELQAPELKTQ